jgi:hypothetical protein
VLLDESHILLVIELNEVDKFNKYGVALVIVEKDPGAHPTNFDLEKPSPPAKCE